jgi:hypothetical protein
MDWYFVNVPRCTNFAASVSASPFNASGASNSPIVRSSAAFKMPLAVRDSTSWRPVMLMFEASPDLPGTEVALPVCAYIPPEE